MPGAWCFGIGIAQLNIYLQLILRVSSIQRSIESPDEAENATKYLKLKERIAELSCCLMILIYPILFPTEIVIKDDDNHHLDIKNSIKLYYRQIWIGILLISAGLISSSAYIVFLIQKLFHNNEPKLVKDKRTIYVTMSAFLFTYFVKVTISILMVTIADDLLDVVVSRALFAGGTLLFWTT